MKLQAGENATIILHICTISPPLEGTNREKYYDETSCFFCHCDVFEKHHALEMNSSGNSVSATRLIQLTWAMRVATFPHADISCVISNLFLISIDHELLPRGGTHAVVCVNSHE